MLTLLGRDSVQLGSRSKGLGRVFDGCVITWVASSNSFQNAEAQDSSTLCNFAREQAISSSLR